MSTQYSVGRRVDAVGSLSLCGRRAGGMRDAGGKSQADASGSGSGGAFKCFTG